MIKIQGNSGLVLNEHFNNPMELMDRAFEIIKSNNIERLMRGVNMDYPEFITIVLKGVYENGVAYEITCYPDEAAGKYDTATSACLIVKNDGNVDFIITGVDRRIEANRTAERLKEGSSWGVCNDAELQAELKTLGRRIDQRYTKKSTIIGRRRNVLLKEKIALLVKQSGALIGSALYEHRKKNEASVKH